MSVTGQAPSTVSREVAAHGFRQGYRAWRAGEQAVRAARRPKVPELARHARLRAEGERRLALDFPDNPEMRVSHETIYRSLFVQARGGLRRELTRYLRSGRTQCRSQGRAAGAGRLRDMVSISERPSAVEDRAVPGQWEGDLMMGRGGRSYIGTLVEQQSRYVLLFEPPDYSRRPGS